MPLMLSNRLSISQKSQNKPTQRPPPPGRHKGEPCKKTDANNASRKYSTDGSYQPTGAKNRNESMG